MRLPNAPLTATNYSPLRVHRPVAAATWRALVMVVSRAVQNICRPCFVGRLLWYHIGVAIEYTNSASKHGISHEDALYAMLNAEAIEVVPGRPGEVTRVFVGHPHPQTDRYIEVLAAQRGDDFVVFHVMPLSDLYRHLLRRNS